MLGFTRQERQVVIFLSCAGLIGLGINFLQKVNSPLKEIISPDYRLFKIDLNQAQEGDLLTLRLISPKLAKKIIEYRDSRGQFISLEELKDIKGIGDYRYEKLKDLFFIK